MTTDEILTRMRVTHEGAGEVVRLDGQVIGVIGHQSTAGFWLAATEPSQACQSREEALLFVARYKVEHPDFVRP